MPEDKLTQEIHAMFANTKMEATKAYLDRGRQFEADATGDLKARWIAQLAAVADATPAHDRQLYDDLESELGLRGIEAPADEVPEIVKRLVARSKAQTNSWTPEQLWENEARVQQELDKVRPSKTEKN
jgi:hypothetical protein